MSTAPTYSLDELCALVDLPKRTVRYYIQHGLVDRPAGLNRGAHYTAVHVEQLLFIRKWQDAGVSLERIRELLHAPADALPPSRPRGPGTVEVWSRILVRHGLELHVEPSQAGLSPEALREFIQQVGAAFDALHSCAPE